MIYIKKTGPLQEMFSCSTSKILDFMCVFDSYDYSMSDIARNSGIIFKTALNEIKELESQGVIKQTQTSGKSIMYQWNKDSAQAKSIYNFALDIAMKNAVT